MRLIALTGWGQDTDREQTRAAGFDHHLLKPADPADIAASLRRPGADDERRSTGDGAFRLAVARPLEHLDQLLHRHRLDQVQVEAGFPRAAPVLVLAPAGQRDQRTPCPHRPRPNRRGRPRSRSCPAGRCRAARRPGGICRGQLERLRRRRGRCAPRGPMSRSSMARLSAASRCRRRPGRAGRPAAAAGAAAARCARRRLAGSGPPAGARRTRCPCRARRCAPRRGRRASRPAA